MGFLNIFEKDSDSKQKRIEHRGKYARLSRTDGFTDLQLIINAPNIEILIFC